MPIDMKNMIADTLRKMIKTRNVDKITVKALIEECHVSRQTFYYHFQDLMDVFEYSVSKITDELLALSLQAENAEAAIGVFIAKAVENYALIAKLLASSRRGEIERMMIHAVRIYLQEIIRKKAPELSLSYADLNITIEFYSYGITGLLLEHCGKPDLDEDKLAHQMHCLLSGKMFHLEEDTSF